MTPNIEATDQLQSDHYDLVSDTEPVSHICLRTSLLCFNYLLMNFEAGILLVVMVIFYLVIKSTMDVTCFYWQLEYFQGKR